MMRRGMDELLVGAELENMEKVIAERLENCAVKVRNKIHVAVDEIFANIAHYAYDRPGGGVTVRVAVGEDIHIEFEDSGVAYDPLASATPDISLSAADREVGGLGVFIVKKTMDSVEYRREGCKNILVIKKSLE